MDRIYSGNRAVKLACVRVVFILGLVLSVGWGAENDAASVSSARSYSVPAPNPVPTAPAPELRRAAPRAGGNVSARDIIGNVPLSDFNGLNGGAYKDWGNEPYVAVDPTNLNHVVVSSFAYSSTFGSNNASVWYSNDGGLTWALRYPIPSPAAGTSVPADQNFIYDSLGLLHGVELSQSADQSVYLGSTTDPNSDGQAGRPGNLWTYTGKINAFGSGNTDQPWMAISGSTVFVAYDDFSNNQTALRAINCTNNGTFVAADLPVSQVMPNNIVNPGLRICADNQGRCYALWGRGVGSVANGTTIEYRINRYTSGNAWDFTSLNTYGGLIVDGGTSKQFGTPYFGTKNELRGNITSIACDPAGTHVYTAYGLQNGNNVDTIILREFHDDGTSTHNLIGRAGNTLVSNVSYRTALPSVAVLDNGTIAVMYMASPSADNFEVHFVTSTDQGVSFSGDTTLFSFNTSAFTLNTPAVPDGSRLFGDYVKLLAVGNMVYGVFPGTGNTNSGGINTTGMISPYFFSKDMRTSDTLTVAQDGESYSEKDQTIVLTAQVNPSSGTVNDGTVTFQLKDGATPIGSAVTSPPVLGNNAAVQYILPGSTPDGFYTISATYNGGLDFGPSGLSGAVLLLNGTDTSVAASNVNTPYSNSDTVVKLNATVTAANASTVNSGYILFSVRDSGFNVIGTTTPGNVANGAASVNYLLPGGTASGGYKIEAEYYDNNFNDSTDQTHTLTVKAQTFVSAQSTYAFYENVDQTVPISIFVVAPGTVNEGSVTVQLRDQTPATAAVGSPVTANVAGGQATVQYVVPGKTPIGNYTINVNYTGGNNFGDSSSSSQTVQIIQASPNVAAFNTSATLSSKDTTVTLGAEVTSDVGIVDEGTVHFVVLKTDLVTPLGTSPQPALVSKGFASVSYVIPGGTAAGSYRIHAFYSGGPTFSYNSDDSHNLTLGKTAPVVSSALSAFPTLTSVKKDISFFVAVSGPKSLTYDWDLGDGTTVSTTTGSLTYAYSVAGTYTVTVIVTDPATKASTFSATTVTTYSAIVGVGLDSDGDGFSDVFENYFATDPNNPLSTPLGRPVTQADVVALGKVKVQIVLDYSSTASLKDVINFIATVTPPAGTTPANLHLSKMDVSGVPYDASGVVSQKNTKKVAQFTIQMKGNFKAALADAGLKPADIKNEPVDIVFTLIVNNVIYQQSQKLKYTYTSKKMQGTAK